MITIYYTLIYVCKCMNLTKPAGELHLNIFIFVSVLKILLTAKILILAEFSLFAIDFIIQYTLLLHVSDHQSSVNI